LTYGILTARSRWTTEITNSKTSYGLIPHDHWYQPDWIDENRAKAARDEMERQQVRFLLMTARLWSFSQYSYNRSSTETRKSQSRSSTASDIKPLPCHRVPYRNMCRYNSGVCLFYMTLFPLAIMTYTTSERPVLLPTRASQRL
jgi:hypothetical protein